MRTPNHPDHFGSTRWSLILSAAAGEVVLADRAIEELCEIYWQPVYEYVHRKFGQNEDAADLTQEFFCHFLRTKGFTKADPARGKFRCFLLTSLKNFLVSEHRRATTDMRGGDHETMPFGRTSENQADASSGIYGLTPEQLFERDWTLAILRQVMNTLKNEYEKRGALPVYENLKGFLTGQTSGESHTSVARKLGITETASRANLKRLRARFRDHIYSEIRQTLLPTESVDEEIDYLFQSIGRH